MVVDTDHRSGFSGQCPAHRLGQPGVDSYGRRRATFGMAVAHQENDLLALQPSERNFRGSTEARARFMRGSTAWIRGIWGKKFSLYMRSTAGRGTSAISPRTA